MLEWVNWAADQVDRIASKDEIYLGLLGVQRELGDAFDRFLLELPEEDRTLVLDYLDVVSEMEYRKS